MAALSLTIDGMAHEAALAACVTSVVVHQALNAPAMACVTYADPPSSLTSGLTIGKALEVRAPGGDLLLSGEITAVETCLDPGNIRTLRIRAYDRLHRLRKAQTVRALADVGLGELLSQSAQEIGVSADVIGDAPPGRTLTIQGEESTSDLLLQAAAAAGRYVCLVGDQLRLMSLGGDGDTAIKLAAGENLLQARVEANAETMRRATVARGWDTAQSDLIENRAGLAAQDAIELRGDALSAFPGLGERLLVNRVSASREEALALAQADMDRATALAATLEATTEGDPGLRPGRIVSISGIGGSADGDYVLTEAEHSFDMVAGYVTRISTIPPPQPRRAPGGNATIARVISTKDPDKLARVKARLTAFGEVESGWMPVLAIGAGRNKGLCVLPEVDDDVLVLLPDGDPARGIVLGGLYGALTPPGKRPSSGVRTFTMRTPNGQVLTLDGAQSIARLETGAGDVLEMSPRGTKLSVTRDLTIEAPGKTISMRALRRSNLRQHDAVANRRRTSGLRSRRQRRQSAIAEPCPD